MKYDKDYIEKQYDVMIGKMISENAVCSSDSEIKRVFDGVCMQTYCITMTNSLRKLGFCLTAYLGNIGNEKIMWE